MQASAQTEIPPGEFELDDCAPEERYSRSVSASHRRKFGQVFTPPRLAGLMADWVMGNAPGTLLDPAYGTGVLAAACLALDSELDVTAYEIDSCVLKYARNTTSRLKIRNRDFIEDSIDDRYDAVIMNPPYIRHREISGYDRQLSAISTMSNVAIPKSANLYIYFSIKAIELLNPNGRAAILVPGEWMSANFSKTFKEYLISRNILRNIVLFSNCSNVFEGALTTASVLLCEK